MGVFESIRGLLVGRPMGYTAEQVTELDQVLLDRTAKFHIPVVSGMDFGHTSPQVTIPIGCTARVDTAARRFEIIEPAVH